MRRSFPGHRATLTPLGPVSYPRQPVAEGWRATCLCGWDSGHGPTRREVKERYTTHLIAALPICSRCKLPTPRSAMSTGAKHLCKKCSTAKTREWAAANPRAWDRHRRKSVLKRRYNMTLEQFDALLASQGGVCAICRNPPTDPRGFRPHVDHDHATGKVRGVLCWKCNSGLGSFRDSPDLLAAAIAYLGRGRQPS
jgi:hypothetical protein